MKPLVDLDIIRLCHCFAELPPGGAGAPVAFGRGEPASSGFARDEYRRENLAHDYATQHQVPDARLKV